MKLSKRPKKVFRIAAPVLLAILLAIAILPAAAFAQPPDNPGGPPGGGPNGGPGGNPNSPTNDPPGNGGTNTPNTDPPSTPPGNGGTNTPGTNPPGNGGTNTPGTNPPGNGGTTTPTQPQPQPHPSAPFTPPADCIVAHAATPAQLCSVGGGLQYYFIGADGSSSQGPWISPFGDLATAASASVYSGTNPLTGKSVQITYLAAENKIRISTFYPDTEYDTNKPYNFTVDANNSVSHEAW